MATESVGHGSIYPGQVLLCCGRMVLWTAPLHQLVNQMADPPHTTDRWHVTQEWQCTVRKDHHGIATATTDERAGL